MSATFSSIALTRLENKYTYYLYKTDGFLLQRGQPCSRVLPIISRSWSSFSYSVRVTKCILRSRAIFFFREFYLKPLLLILVEFFFCKLREVPVIINAHLFPIITFLKYSTLLLFVQCYIYFFYFCRLLQFLLISCTVLYCVLISFATLSARSVLSRNLML